MTPAEPATTLDRTEKTLKAIELPEGVFWVDTDQLLFLLARPGHEGGHRAAFVAYLMKKHPQPDLYYYRPVVLPLKTAVASGLDADVLQDRIRVEVGLIAKRFAYDISEGKARTIQDIGEFDILDSDYVRLR
jgi:hypothetical protein